MARAFAMLAVAAALVIAGCGGFSSTTGRTAPTAQVPGLRIEGDHFVSASGRTVFLHGVVYASFEGACTRGHGVSSQPIDAAAAHRLVAWHVNFVRIGVAEDCWLGLNGEPRGTTVSTYRLDLRRWVDQLHRDGIYTEIGLVYAAPSRYPSILQAPMPDEDHAPAFWHSFAAFFRDTPDVIFGLYGEPHPYPLTGSSWACWLHGGSACAVSYNGTPYVAAGMQQLINVIRATGARQPISVSGIDHAQDLSGWLSNEPFDPVHQLDAEWHEYGGGYCSTPACWSTWPAQIAAKVPLLNGELGEHLGLLTCRWSFMPRYLAWATAHHVSYAAWKYGVDFGTCANMALIRDVAGDPTPIYGQRYRAWLAAHDG